MSYGWTAYCVDEKSLCALFGHMTEAQCQQLRHHYRAPLQQLTTSFAEPAEAALQHIADGQLDDDISASLYWYVLELLADWHGERLANSEFYPAELMALAGIDGVSTYFINHPWLDLPDDFPSVSICRHARLEDARRSVLSGELTPPQQQQLLSWLAQAQHRQQDLLLFYY